MVTPSRVGRLNQKSIKEMIAEDDARRYREALLRARGNKSQAAKSLGIHVNTLKYRLKKNTHFADTV